MTVSPIPAGYHSVTPYLCIKGAAKAIAFYKEAFGAKEVMEPIVSPDGAIGHAEIQIGNSRIMLSDEFPSMQVLSPQSLGGSAVHLMIYVEDVDKAAEQAIAAGAEVIRPVEKQFYGDRSGQFADPFGYRWTLATHVEDVPADELKRRAAAMFS